MGKGIVIPFIRKKPPDKEELSEKDWKELMGMNKDIYVKNDGTIRKK